MKKILLICLAFCCLFSCSNTLPRSPGAIISTKNSALPPHEVLGDIELEWCINQYVMVPISSKRKDIMEEAKQLGGNAITQYYASASYSASLFYSKTCILERATAIKTKDGAYFEGKGVENKPVNSTVQPSQTTSQSDPYEELEKLAKLKDKGIISEAEFESKKKEILSR